MELLELDASGEICTLIARDHVDKVTFRDACTQWLVDGGTECYLAAPELEHIQHAMGVHMPACEADTGYRCAPDCACETVWMISSGGPGSEPLTVWELTEAECRHRRAIRCNRQ